MFLSLSASSTAATTSSITHHLWSAILRWIVLVELVQNAWSFAVDPTIRSSSGSATSSAQTYPWQQQSSSDRNRKKNDEHRLEDIFRTEHDDEIDTDTGSTSQITSNNGSGDSFEARDLDSFDDGDVVDSRGPTPSTGLEDEDDSMLRP